MPIALRSIATALTLAAAASLQAAPITLSNAAFGATYARDCRSAAAIAAGSTTPDLCNEVTGTFGGTLKEVRQDASYGGVTASTHATNALAQTANGVTRSSVDASGTAGVLALKQGAYSGTPYARVSSQASALQSFTWDGTGASLRTISGALNFVTSNSTTRALFNAATTTPASLIQGAISVFSLGSDSFDVDAGALGTGRPCFECDASARGDYIAEVDQFFADAPSSPLNWLMDFHMVAGRTYFVEAWFGVWAKFGAEIDATHTFTASLGSRDDSGNFVAGIQGLTPSAPSGNAVNIGNTVPEPGSLALALLAGLGLLGKSRARRAASAR